MLHEVMLYEVSDFVLPYVLPRLSLGHNPSLHIPVEKKRITFISK